MENSVININNYSPKSSDVLFFDNNVWMFLFCPLGNYNQKKQNIYSALLQTLQSLKCSIFINSLVVSEFTNRYLRLDFELWKKKNANYSANYKLNYVGSDRYKDTVKEITITINKMLKICEKSTDNFNAIDINKVLEHFELIDFNDSYYLELAQLNHWIFVTDDYDFIKYKNHNAKIISTFS